jgi:hypothetical protein
MTTLYPEKPNIWLNLAISELAHSFYFVWFCSIASLNFLLVVFRCNADPKAGPLHSFT